MLPLSCDSTISTAGVGLGIFFNIFFKLFSNLTLFDLFFFCLLELTLLAAPNTTPHHAWRRDEFATVAATGPLTADVAGAAAS
jgi:hypothetical protein